MELEAKNAEIVADKLARDITPVLGPAMVGLAGLAVGKMSKYAPSSDANSPHQVRDSRGRTQIRWYERGFGPRWVRKRDGSIGGKKTSETYGRSWSVTPVPLGAVMRSAASYSGAVGRDPKSKGRPKQARFHGKRGWVTDRTALKEVLLANYNKMVVNALVNRIVS